MKKNLVEQSYSIISNMIFQYQIAPGTRVSDYLLSKQLGISRTPIRTAIQILVADELLEPDGIKYKVPEITLERIDQVYDARIHIQVGVMKLAMEKGISKDALQKLRDEISEEVECLKSGNIYQSIEHDLNFNRMLCLMCGNPFLIRYYLRLEKQTRLLSLFGMLLPATKGPACYKSVCDCIENNDVEGACAGLITHIESARMQKKQIIESYSATSDMYSHLANNFR